MQAELAARQNEVPVGAVLVDADNHLLASAYNQPIHCQDPSAHAEICCLRQAAQQLNNYRLPGCTLYVTLEPCAMCAGALIQARIKRLVYGAKEPRSGAIDSVFQILSPTTPLNHRIIVTSGILSDASARLLQQFFRQRRK